MLHFSRRELYSTEGYYIPTVMALPHSNPVYNCHNYNHVQRYLKHKRRMPQSKKKLAVFAGKFEIYRLGMYRSCTVQADGKVVNGPVRPSKDCSGSGLSGSAFIGGCSPQTDAAVNQDDLECHRALENDVAVLSYGAMEGSYQRNRERICDMMHANISQLTKHGVGGGLNVLCITGVFGAQLRHFVCKSRMVVVEHFYATSALETHRIDPLIQAKKVVLVTPSSDKLLEDHYRPYLTIAEPAELVEKLNELLGLVPQGHLKTLRSGEVGDFKRMSRTVRELSADVKRQAVRVAAKLSHPDESAGQRPEWYQYIWVPALWLSAVVFVLFFSLGVHKAPSRPL